MAYYYFPSCKATALFRAHCAQIQTEKVVCYCKFCTDGINMGGKTGLHMLELLFPTEKLPDRM